LNEEAGFRRGAGDEVHNRFQADQWLSSPIAGNVTEQPMFDFVPLARARWKMTNPQFEIQVIRQILQSEPVVPNDVSLKTTRVYGDASVIIFQHARRTGDDVKISYSIMHLPGVEITVREFLGKIYLNKTGGGVSKSLTSELKERFLTILRLKLKTSNKSGGHFEQD
jgi:hypothetical protein